MTPCSGVEDRKGVGINQGESGAKNLEVETESTGS